MALLELYPGPRSRLLGLPAVGWLWLSGDDKDDISLPDMHVEVENFYITYICIIIIIYISPPDMHVEVENAEEDEWSQSGCGERMDRLEDNEKPRKILFNNVWQMAVFQCKFRPEP